MRQLFYLLFLTLLIHAGASARSCFAQAQGCPAIAVEGVEGPVCPGKPVTFTVKVAGANSGVKLNYEWTLSAGEIKSGQGTDTITVGTAEIAGHSVRATVKVTGISSACGNTASQETQTLGCCLQRQFDEYGNIAFNDEKARLDNFASQLLNEPEVVGYIVAYGGRVSYAEEANERAKRAKDYLTSGHNLMDERIITIDGGYREDLTVELWVLPRDSTPPYASPTLRAQDVQIVEKPGAGKRGRRRPR